MVGHDYEPSLTISLLDEHKGSYQPNILKAMGVTMILPVVLALYITVFLPGVPDEETVIDASDLIFVEERPFGSETASGTSGETSKSSGSRSPDIRPPAYRHHEGFAGFDGYRIGKDLMFAGSDYIPGGDIPLPEAFPFVSEDLNGTLMLAFESEDQDDGLPESPTFLDLDRPRSLPIDWNIPGFADGEIDIPSRDRPPMIKLEKVKYPRKGWHVNGVVKIVLIVDDEGQIKECEIVQEVPKGHNFALAFKEALNESVFFPARVNGQDVGVRYNFIYDFCWECPEKPEIRVSRSDLIITISPAKPR